MPVSIRRADRPSDPVPPFYLGQILLAAGRHAEARHWLEESLRRDATFQWARLCLDQLSEPR